MKLRAILIGDPAPLLSPAESREVVFLSEAVTFDASRFESNGPQLAAAGIYITGVGATERRETRARRRE